MVAEIGLFEYSDLTPLEFCLWGWIKSEADTLDAAARVNKHGDQLQTNNT